MHWAEAPIPTTLPKSRKLTLAQARANARAALLLHCIIMLTMFLIVVLVADALNQ